MITREEIDTRFADLKEYIGQRFDGVETLLKDHEGRIRTFEQAPVKSPSNLVGWSGLGTGIGAVIMYIWSKVAGNNP